MDIDLENCSSSSACFSTSPSSVLASMLVLYFTPFVKYVTKAFVMSKYVLPWSTNWEDNKRIHVSLFAAMRLKGNIVRRVLTKFFDP